MAGYIGSGASVVSSGAENKKVFDITTNTTSLTGLNYTVGKVHVYHNGVRLVDGTDFTATNSTSITLTVAAVSGDQVVVVSFASYQVALSGIDDQSNATAITIDSSENVLVGLTATEAVGTNAGTQLRADGLVYAAVTSDAHILSRRSSDGAILNFRKDTTTVGSIGTVSAAGDLYISSSDTDHAGLRFSSGRILPYRNGTLSDGTVDLGQTSDNYRFKDLYLSGGIYLGGTGAANKLDDFEEGLYTVSVATGSGSISLDSTNNKFSYVKVGKLVTVTGRIDVSSVSSPSGALYLNLPFAASTGVKYESAISLFIWNSTSSAPETGLWIGWVTNGASQIQIRYGNSNTPSANVSNYIQANTEFRIGVSYETDS